MSLPATANSASLFRVQIPLGSTCEKDSALMHRPYHAAASAEGWMKESLLCSKNLLYPPNRSWGAVLVPDLPKALVHEVSIRKNIGTEETSHSGSKPQLSNIICERPLVKHLKAFLPLKDWSAQNTLPPPPPPSFTGAIFLLFGTLKDPESSSTPEAFPSWAQQRQGSQLQHSGKLITLPNIWCH